MTKDPPNGLTTAEKSRVIEEYVAWKPHGRVVFAGGELLLKLEEALVLAQKCQSLGVSSIGLTNGTLMSEQIALDLCRSGLSQLSISLDAPNAESYDYTRGVPGTFAKVMAAIDALQRAKEKLGKGPSLHVNTILAKSTLEILPDHLAFLESLPVEGVFFSPLTRTLANHQEQDPYFDRECLVPSPAFDAAIDYLLQKKKSPHSLVVNGESDLQLIRDYVREGRASGQICNSGDRNVVVDTKGDVRFCHHMEQKISRGQGLGNVRRQELREICESSAALGFRQLMRACAEDCEMNSCNRNTTCTASLG
jgi:radical SAM protein with 4Fe4S-binding SPASM domain